ncbi:MAG: filamentous hemagglutinin N-terminal domain-containing protein, partial [Marinobacter sp.]|nr:filamentous hemagglutinin N-terminal domain-containing protein [Marinobacter sp.]
MKPSGLNHVYRVVWCASKGVWQAVNELSRTRTRNNSRSVVRKLVAGTGAALLAGGQALAAGLPEHGQITAGSGSISQSGNHMVIDQSSDRMAINWQNFSIGADNSVTFQQPGQSAIALNRVVGHERSVIDGALNANGQVWLLNANGVLFNSSAQINTAGLVASTLDISDDDFMAGKSTFAANGSAASVINLGSITTIDEGYVALLGQQVINEGVITARLGTAALASGDQVTLNFNGNSLVGVTIDRAALNALVENRHAVFADGGMVILTAQGLDEVMATVVNNTGEIRAAGIEEREGRVFLTGIGDYAQTEQRGRVDVSSASGRGGRVEIAGAQVGLWDGAEVDASGATGGGRVLIGGDYQGANPDVTNAKRTFVAAGASVNVDATEQGDGGTAIVWADDITRFNGHISARGGEQGGDGGFVEVSGKDSLIYRGTVDASAAHGAAGQLLLDPKNITIANAGADPADSGSNGFADNAADDVTIDPAAIAALLNAGISVTLQANNDISVVDSLTADATSHAGATVLAMEAGRSISISALMQLFGIDAEFYANHPGADADNRDAGPAVFNNVGFIQARNVDIKIGAGADTGNINTGTIQAVDLNIEHLGESGQVNLGGLTLTNSLTVNASEHDLTVFSAPAASLLQTGSGGVTINAGAGIVDLFNTNISLLSLTAHLAEVTNSQPLSLAAVTILARDAGVTKGQFDLTVTGPVQQSSGHMDIDGTFNFRALQGGFGIQPNDVTFNSSANMFRGDINVLGGRNVTLRSDNHNLSFGSDGVNISGLLTLTTNQDVIFDPASIISIGSSSRFTLNGSTTTDMTGATNISNNIRDFFVSRARDVTLVTQAQSNLILGTSTTANAVTGNLNVTANNMSVNNLRVQGDLALTTHGSSIAQQANNTRMEVGGNLNVTTHTADTDLFLGDRDLSALTHTNSIGGTSTLNTVGTGSWRDIRYRNTATGAGMILGLEGETLRHLAVQLNNPGASIALPTLTLTGGGQTVRLGFDDQSTATFYLETGNATTTVTQAGPLVFDNATAVARFRTGANTTLSLTADNLFRRLRIDDASNIDLVNTVALSLQTVKSRNDFDLELRGEGDIQRDSGALDVAGDASFVSTSGVSNFSHSTSGNSVGGALSFTGFNDVNYGGGHNLNLGETAIAGNLTLSGLGSGYQLSQSGALTVPGTVSLSLFTNGIVLDDAANALGAIGVANMGNGNVHIVENDAITQSGAWVLGSNNDIRLETVGSQAITLDNAGNSFGNITVIQRDDSAQAPGDVAIVSSNSNGIRQGSGVANAWQTFGHTLINAGGNSIDLTNPNNLFGPLQVLGGTALDRSVNLAAKGLIADYAAWNTGRTILTAYSLAGDIGQGDILLTQANTLGNLTLRGRDVTVTEADNITQQQDQAWIINGDLVLDAGANNIIVTQDGNDISRLSILNAGTAAVYDDVGDLQLLTINVADKLTLRAAGSVTQAGALQVSDLRLFGTGSANLNQVNTVDNLAVSLTGGDFNFVNSKTLNLAAIDGTDGISIGTNDVRLEVAMGTITGIAGRINQASTGLELVAETLDLPTLLIDGFITLRASDLINLGGNITATNVGELLFDGDVRITSAGAGIQISTAGSDVTFEGVLDANGKTLAFTDTSGNRRFKGAVSDLGNAAISTPGITLAVGGSTVFESTVQSNTGISADGTVEFRDDVTLGDGVAGSTFTGLVILGKAGGMDFSGFDGLRFDGGLQLQNGPSTISSNGSLLQLGGPVTGAFDLTLDAGVGENATITSGSLSNLGSEITGLTVRANALTLPGNFTIAGAQTFEVTNVNNAIQLGGDLASTAVGAITFLSDVQLTSNSSVTSVNSEIRFASNVFGAQQLDLNSGNGKVVLDGEVGGSAALSHFRSLGTGDLEMAGGLLRTTGLISSVGDLVITAASILDSDAGDISLQQIDGAHALTLNSTGTTSLAGAVNTASLSTNAGGTTAINGGAVTTSGIQSYGNAVTLGDHTDLSASSVSFAGTVTGNGHDLSISDDLTTAQALSGLGSVQVGGAASLGAGI